MQISFVDLMHFRGGWMPEMAFFILVTLIMIMN